MAVPIHDQQNNHAEVVSQKPNSTLPGRSAGVLLHITSLPGEFGIGDFGPEAFQFIDFLSQSGQKYWQILPLNSTHPEAGHSPYSSQGSFSLNPLFIDPHHLKELGLINKSSLKKYRLEVKSRLDYTDASNAKTALLSEAYEAFRKGAAKELTPSFLRFVEENQFWLSDFALFECMSSIRKGSHWNEWPSEWRNRDEEALNTFQGEHEMEIRAIYFQQFIAAMQWARIKSYANETGIQIMGDLPIYVAYNSADVWSKPEIFKLNANSTMAEVAGVPPDYFNENGQRWNMPIYRWDVLKNEGYKWWLSRIAKNLECVDLLRLDHFRGFSAFWQIPSDSETAREGKWVKGPGSDFFKAVKKQFPEMPFVAEDLGDIDDKVYALRDAYHLPGMKVLQFGFGKNLKKQEHNPDNYTKDCIAYSGTHDNNTLLAWYSRDVGRKTKRRIKKYVGKKVKKSLIHLELIRKLFASAAMLTMVAMQDWLGLDEKGRMNYPSTTKGNWSWRMKKASINTQQSKLIRKISKETGRLG